MKERDLEVAAAYPLDDGCRSDVMTNVLRLPRSLLNLEDTRWPVEKAIHEVIQIVTLPLLVQSFVRHPAVPLRSGFDLFRNFHSFFQDVLHSTSVEYW
jgi:hypothetical protein